MKRSELTNKQKLSVPCPICAAAIGEQCKMYSGQGRRNEPHAERKYHAIQAIEQQNGLIILALGTRSMSREPLGARLSGAHDVKPHCGQSTHLILASLRTDVFRKLLFSLGLAEARRFGRGSTPDGLRLWKSASAPVTFVSVKRIN